MEQRQDIKDLYKQGVLQNENIAPALQGAANDLEMNIKKDTVKKKMEHRTDKRDLYKQGVLQNESVAPSLQGTAVALEQNIKVCYSLYL